MLSFVRYKRFLIGTEFLLMKTFSLSSVLGLIMISLLMNSCINVLDKTLSAGTYHEDLTSLVYKKSLDVDDTIILSRLISRRIVTGEDLGGFTYRLLKEEADTLALQASVDIKIIRSCFERERQEINTDSLIMAMNPVWYLNDTLKFYYATLLINGISPGSKALGKTETVIGEMISSDMLANELIFNRISFRADPPFYNDDVADMKIFHFAFNGDRNLNGVISKNDKERYLRNGWRIIEIP